MQPDMVAGLGHLNVDSDTAIESIFARIEGQIQTIGAGLYTLGEFALWGFPDIQDRHLRAGFLVDLLRGLFRRVTPGDCY